MKLDCEDTTRITIRYHQTRFNQHIRVPIIAGYISKKKDLVLQLVDPIETRETFQ